MTYREQIKTDIPNITDNEINHVVSGLFDPDIELSDCEIIENSSTHIAYKINENCILNVCFSGCDTVDMISNGEISETYLLEY